MKVIEKPVYYCDHCKKHRLTKNSMQLHESKCLYNPDRECRAVYCAGVRIAPEHFEYVRENMTSDMSGDFYGIDLEHIEKLREDMLEGCPVCTVAVLCQAVKLFKKENIYFSFYYDFKPIHNDLYEEWSAENIRNIAY